MTLPSQLYIYSQIAVSRLPPVTIRQLSILRKDLKHCTSLVRKSYYNEIIVKPQPFFRCFLLPVTVGKLHTSGSRKALHERFLLPILLYNLHLLHHRLHKFHPVDLRLHQTCQDLHPEHPVRLRKVLRILPEHYSLTSLLQP